MADAVAQLAALLGRVGAVVTLDYDRSTALPCVCCGTTDERAWCLGGLHWNWIVFARRLGTSPWPTTPGGTPTRAIYAYALGGRCRPWNLYRWQIHNGRWEIPDVEPPPCRRGLPICHEHDDCRRSLALGVACAGMRRRDAVRPSVVRPSGSVAWLVDSQTGALVWMCEPADA